MKKGFAIWFTGMPSSGKTTLAKKIAERLRKRGFKVIVLESDELRKLLTPNPKYTEEERNYFYRTIAIIGKLFVENGHVAIIDATAHKREYRDYARKIIDNLLEVYVSCPVDKCIERDVKGLYKKALKGEIKTLPGLQIDYEEPVNPEVKVETDKESIEESTQKIVKVIKEKFVRDEYSTN